jgi:hypothetical protein
MFSMTVINEPKRAGALSRESRTVVMKAWTSKGATSTAICICSEVSGEPTANEFLLLQMG